MPQQYAHIDGTGDGHLRQRFTGVERLSCQSWHYLWGGVPDGNPATSVMAALSDPARIEDAIVARGASEFRSQGGEVMCHCDAPPWNFRR